MGKRKSACEGLWKDYSSGYIKNNRAASLSVIVAAFISSLLLSLLCSLFYNLWVYEIERLKAEEGDWQGRITVHGESSVMNEGHAAGKLTKLIEQHPNVEKAVVDGELSEKEDVVIDVYFRDMRSIFEDMPQAAELAGLSAEEISFHYSLLNMYLIRDSEDSALRWIFPFSLMILAIACLSLVLVIHNAFAVTMNARIHQFGIFSSIGATPGQIRACLLQEAFALCAVPILLGNLLGILLAMGILEGTNVLLADVEGRLALPFTCHPLILAVSLLAGGVTVWISAWIPAEKMGRMTPLAAIKNTGELSLKRKKSSRILSLLFGVEGELAGNALKAQRKAMRTAFCSLFFSFLAFSLMMCFFTIAVVSQRETYFEKYQDAWDIMVTVKNTDIAALEESGAVATLQDIDGVQSSVMYQKAAAKRLVSQDEISGEMQEIGGFENAPSTYVSALGDGWLVNAPLVIMDDNSFLEYCGQIGAEPGLDGAVILNKTLDFTDPNFRKRRALTYLTGTGQTTLIRQADGRDGQAELPVLAYTREAPNLREEYGTLDFYELVHFIPLSCWKEIREQIKGTEEDAFVRILAKDGESLTELNKIGEEVLRVFGNSFETEMENRIQKKRDNDRMIGGMKAILSVFCILLAVIGIGNVFSNTLGFVRQRKREFARLLSVGMAPRGIKKIFCIEALVIAGRPLLITLPITAAAVIFFVKMSYLEPMLFVSEMPFLPIALFVLAVFGFVALAYYVGAKKVLESDLIESLRDDTVI